MNRHAPGAGEDTPAGYSRYMQRKADELTLIERGLSQPFPPPRPSHLASLLKRKFKSAALCRAEMAAEQWSQTETRWKAGPCGSGAFRFDYEYQRADLTVAGPAAYGIPGIAATLLPTQYTSSGMAAMSAAILAMQRHWPRCSFDARPDGYPETRELINLLKLGADDGGGRIAIIDSTVDTPGTARARIVGATAAIFDTSCFAASSSRIRAVVAHADRTGVPLVLIRSHTKLDCFGLDYGRLGSVVVARTGTDQPEPVLDGLVADFIRLTGSAALPLHFPPFAGGPAYRGLSRARSAWTIRCTRRITAHLKRVAKVDVRSFAHGLYVVFYPAFHAQKEDASQAAAGLIARLVDAGVPARHAGSFGFDFFGCDWFQNPENGRLGLRLSVGDLPLCLVDRAINVLDDWLKDAERSHCHEAGASIAAHPAA